jgi:PLP dependent protein
MKMHPVARQLLAVKQTLPSHVKLVAVSKTQTPETIMAAYHAGQRIFGENKAQEIILKAPALPPDIAWHFIGHLQTNKVKAIIPFVDFIHSIDSMKLLVEVNKQASLIERKIHCLLQFHIASEESKYGLSIEEAETILESQNYKELQHVVIAGVMGMATLTDDIDLITREFRMLKKMFDHLQSAYFAESSEFCEISMGMSDDYPLAIREGATMIRVGSRIFFQNES